MIQHSKPTIEGDDINSVVVALRNKRLSAGNITQSFIQALKVFFNAKGVFLTPSGTEALASGLRLLQMGENKEVIIPAYVCSNVAQAVLMAEAIPVVVDINKSDFNISYQDTMSKINSHTGAVILPPMFGEPIQDMDMFLKLGIPIIEDLAQSIGGQYKGRRLGTFTEMAMCSFSATKMITTGEGGALIINSDYLLSRVNGLDSFKMPDFQSSLGLSQLNKLGTLIEKRRSIAKYYTEALKGIPLLSIRDYDEDCLYYRFIGRVDKSIKIEKIIFDLNNIGIRVMHYTDLVLNSLGIDPYYYPNTNRAIESVLSIPIYPSLSDDDVDFVVKGIKQVMALSSERREKVEV